MLSAMVPRVEYPWRVKQRQAGEHISRFSAAADDYVARANLGLRYDIDPDVGTVGVRLHADSEPPLALGAIIGDVLHNLRSALDSVAWETCQRAGMSVNQESRVYFPIGTDSARWPALAARHLPNVSAEHLQVFERFQPWYWDEQARQVGVDTERPMAGSHPLAKLHELAKMDRHRVTHPVLAREGHTWLGHEEGVTAEILRAGRATVGEVFLEWRVDPPSAAASVHPGGEVVLALSEESAMLKRTALSELKRMHQEVVHATRTVEVEVLGVVTSEDLSRLGELERAWQEAEGALRSALESTHIDSSNHFDEYRKARDAEEQARSAYNHLWTALFD